MKHLNRDLIFECLRELGDRELQERLWTGKIHGKQSSFEEAVEGLFTDSGLEGELRKGTTGFSVDLVSKLKELDGELSKVSAHGIPAKIIADPAMFHVRELAATARNLLQDEMK